MNLNGRTTTVIKQNIVETKAENPLPLDGEKKETETKNTLGKYDR